MLFDHYLLVQTRSSDFIAFEAKIESTLVWIHFSSLNMAYYNDSILWTMAS